MKKSIKLMFVTMIFLFTNSALAQIQIDSLKTYIIKKNDGSEIVARIISQDLREFILETKAMGRFIMPKHEVLLIQEAKPFELNENGEIIPTEIFNTRYFITTNGLPIKKGDSYLLWNLYGPDFQFGLGKNFGMGVTTTWIGCPIIANAKYSISLDENVHIGLGGLLGSGSYLAPNFYLALPFAAITFGNTRVNINFSGGYGYVSNYGSGSGRALASMAAMFKVTKSMSVVFDSFLMPRTQDNSGLALIIPGLRFQTDKNKAFQFGFAGVSSNSNWLPIPIPMVQWFRSL
ncbi:MAG: hypothetical protein WCR21_13480 [Bacteroidota bacterium]